MLRHSALRENWWLCLPTLVLCLPVTVRGEEFFDDFTLDGDVTDCDPICWRVPDCCPGDFLVTPEGLEVRNPGELDTVLLTEDVFSGDVAVRVRGTFNGTVSVPNAGGVYPEIGAWHEEYGGYVDVNGRLSIFRLSDYSEQIGQLDFDVPEGDLQIELLTKGDVLELRVWRADEERPEEPQVTRVDARFRTGAAGFASAFFEGNPIIIRSIRIMPPASEVAFLRGECNDDGQVDVSDASCILDWQFLGGPAPGCIAATNTNGDKGIDIADAIYLLGSLFLGGPPPAPPFPACGPGTLPVDDQLGCAAPNCKSP